MVEIWCVADGKELTANEPEAAATAVYCYEVVGVAGKQLECFR